MSENMASPVFDPERIQVGISSCLLGQNVRFDGGHKQSSLCQNELATVFDYQPICPEVAIGLPIPRPAIRLVEDGEQIRLRGSQDAQLDVTEPMQTFAAQQVAQLSALSGYIVCAKSPSCGMERVKIFAQEQGHPASHKGRGLFTQKLMEQHPLLPVEENGRLNDPVLRDNFVTRVFIYHQWQALQHKGLTAHDLVEFHARHKFLLLAHKPAIYRQLGPLVAQLGEQPLAELAEQYIALMMTALNINATRRNHTNVLQHIQGFFKKLISSEERQALADVIDQYRLGKLPLMAPITLIRHLLVKFPDPYIAKQSYLRPYPDSLGLRNQL